MAKPTFLVTNDDGIQVFFLHSLVRALSKYGTVYVAAPKQEQSWVGKAVSRHRDVAVQSYHGFPGVDAWEVDGTPSDAVNIALGHLLPQKPDAVISGINVGWNAMVPVVFSSGTVAGALEGASWGIPAIALSIHLHAEDFDQVKEDPTDPVKSIKRPVEIAAELGAEFAASKAGESNENLEVYNVNFPANLQSDTPWSATQPGRITLGSLFEKSSKDTYQFRYREHTQLEHKTELPSDYDVFSDGGISLSILNFQNVSRAFKL